MNETKGVMKFARKSEPGYPLKNSATTDNSFITGDHDATRYSKMTKIRDTSSYTKIAVLIHWSIAALIFLNLVIGSLMEGLPRSLKPFFIPLHVSSGITVLVLTLFRIAWRLTHKPPELLTSSRVEAFTAKCVHLLLYGMMLYIPLTGWSLISANPPPGVIPRAQPSRGAPPRIWGLVKLPLVTPLREIATENDGVARQKVIHDDLVEAHWLGAILLAFLLVLHIAGALKHEFFDGRPLLRRMTISRALKTPEQAE